MHARPIFLRVVQVTSAGIIHTADAIGSSAMEKGKNNKQHGKESLL